MTKNNKENTIKQDKKYFDQNEEVSSDTLVNDQKEEVNDETIEEKLKLSEEKLLRSLAEIENQRRRFEKEVKDAFEFGSFNFAKESLAILDNLERAKLAMQTDEKLKDSKDLSKFLENLTIIKKDLVSIFEKNKIKKIITENSKFDPNLHQAMTEIEDEKAETGSIVQEIQTGYMLGDRLLRPALVAVAKKKVVKKPEKEEKKGE